MLCDLCRPSPHYKRWRSATSALTNVLPSGRTLPDWLYTRETSAPNLKSVITRIRNQHLERFGGTQPAPAKLVTTRGRSPTALAATVGPSKPPAFEFDLLSQFADGPRQTKHPFEASVHRS